ETLLPLVEHLLAKEPDILSLLAVIDDQCVGHILLPKGGVGDRKHCVAPWPSRCRADLAVARRRQAIIRGDFVDWL
ncbi:MAG: hypothetical protein M5U07_20825, partial [Xanthobacteraceae bacterium]|nr:hypothetical protein [Xanthobacteraceae bacterium]